MAIRNKRVKVYLAGPMTGFPNFNRPAFNVVNDILLDQGHVVVNPTVLPDGLEHGEYIKICLPMIDACNCIIMLPGWEKSKGARVEYAYALVKRLTVFEIAHDFVVTLHTAGSTPDAISASEFGLK